MIVYSWFILFRTINYCFRAFVTFLWYSSILTWFWQLDIAYDKFIRTTDSKHEAVVKEFYSRVLANGDIYQADYEGLYCVNCEEYKVIVQILSYISDWKHFTIAMQFSWKIKVINNFYTNNLLLWYSLWLFYRSQGSKLDNKLGHLSHVIKYVRI